MQLSGLRFGQRLLSLVDFPFAETLGGDATNEELKAFLDRHGRAVVKPVFHGGVGKKGKAGLVRVVDNLQDALAAKKELYFATHRYGPRTVTANGVSFEAYIPSEVEVYFSIDASTVPVRAEVVARGGSGSGSASCRRWIPHQPRPGSACAEQPDTGRVSSTSCLHSSQLQPG